MHRDSFYSSYRHYRHYRYYRNYNLILDSVLVEESFQALDFLSKLY